MAHDTRYWDWLSIPSGKKCPIGRESFFHIKGEKLVDPEFQVNKNKRSCYYKSNEAKIGTIPKEYKYDSIGRIIIPLQDICIFLWRTKEPLQWIPLYYTTTGGKVCFQCITPGYEEYRAFNKPERTLVITDQIKSNDERNNTTYTLTGTTRFNTIKIHKHTKGKD